MIVSRNLAKHYESHENLPFFCFKKSESFKIVTRSVALTRSNSLLLKRTNDFIRRAMETGLIQKWDAVSSKNIINEDNRHGPIVMTVEHIYIAMIVYGLGFIFATLVFAGEHLAHKYIVRNNSQNRNWICVEKCFFSTERVICLPRKSSA